MSAKGQGLLVQLLGIMRESWTIRAYTRRRSCVRFSRDLCWMHASYQVYAARLPRKCWNVMSFSQCSFFQRLALQRSGVSRHQHVSPDKKCYMLIALIQNQFHSLIWLLHGACFVASTPFLSSLGNTCKRDVAIGSKGGELAYISGWYNPKAVARMRHASYPGRTKHVNIGWLAIPCKLDKTRYMKFVCDTWL